MPAPQDCGDDMPSSIVLLSAGLDSTVNLKCALDEGAVAAALTFHYGQKAARAEVARARRMCQRYGVRHNVIPLPWLKAITRTALVRGKVPRPKADALDDHAAATKSATAVWVPNRNGVFLAIAGAFAESLGAEQVVTGFNAEEAATFPDNTAAFLRAATRAFEFSTMSHVRAMSYTTRLKKPAIVRLGLERDAPMDLIWPCYLGGKRICGRCESCMRFRRAVTRADAEEWFCARAPELLRD